MTPTTAESWLLVARERAADAEAMFPGRDHSAGPVYLAGYAVECSLKAYLQCRGLKFPSHGSEGHNLRGLWHAADFRVFDLDDRAGEKTYYLGTWSTDLRYEGTVDPPLPVALLLKGAKELTGWIQNQVRRSRRAR
ncbi:MAG: HEPN domain-containing protein [Deltaproteobacteria bacterium]|nr:HEPN domain-containing protein [Deltaproteobacteria bacterium]